MKLRILTAADVRQALPMRRAIEVMKSAFGQLSADQATVPLRMRMETDQGLMLLMPAFLQQTRELGFKMVTIWGDNPSKGLPAVTAIALAVDPDTGLPAAVINGEALTGIRTGAGGGLAAALLARADAQVVTVFGSGVQARAQLEAVLVVRPITEIRIVGRTAASVETFAAEVRAWAITQELGATVTLPATPQAAVTEADIIIAATTSATPVFAGQHLSAGAHVTGVGSYAPHLQEVDVETLQRSKIVVDSRTGCLAEAGDLVIPIKQGLLSEGDIYAELGELVNGTLPARESAAELTYFKSVGVAVQDAAAASEILRVAEAQDLGQIVNL